MSNYGPLPKQPCEYCGRETALSHMHMHVAKCAANPDVDRRCKHCGETTTRRLRRGLCRKCYDYEYLYGEPRPLDGTGPDYDIDVDELPRLADIEEPPPPEGLFGIAWSWTVRQWDVHTHRYVDAVELQTVLLK